MDCQQYLVWLLHRDDKKLRLSHTSRQLLVSHTNNVSCGRVHTFPFLTPDSRFLIRYDEMGETKVTREHRGSRSLLKTAFDL